MKSMNSSPTNDSRRKSTPAPVPGDNGNATRLLAAGLTVLAAVNGWAAESEFGSMGFEELGRIKVTTVARSESTVQQSPAAVCDDDALFVQGVMINFLLVKDTVCFEVKLDPAARAGIKFRSDLLGAAKRVWPKSGSDAPQP